MKFTTYPSKKVHTSFFTDEDDNYRIEEVVEPFGYVLNDNYMEVKVASDIYEAIITVDYENAPAVDELTIEKKEFVYKEGSFSSAKFEVYAAEDIFTVNMQVDDKTPVIYESVSFANYPTKFEISKTDIIGKFELMGATFSIIDKDGNVVETWKSDREIHYIERIPVREYIFREEAVVKITVENTKKIQKISMKDELVSDKIIIEKTDEVTGKGIAVF